MNNSQQFIQEREQKIKTLTKKINNLTDTDPRADCEHRNHDQFIVLLAKLMEEKRRYQKEIISLPCSWPFGVDW